TDLACSRGAPTLPVRVKENRVVVTPLADRVRIAGALEFGTGVPRSYRRSEALRAVAARAVPALRDAEVVDRWTGRSPCRSEGRTRQGAVGRRRSRHVGADVGADHGPRHRTRTSGGATGGWDRGLGVAGSGPLLPAASSGGESAVRPCREARDEEGAMRTRRMMVALGSAAILVTAAACGSGGDGGGGGGDGDFTRDLTLGTGGTGGVYYPLRRESSELNEDAVDVLQVNDT